MTEANSLNISNVGILGNTGTAITATAVTQYDVIVGGSTSSTLSSVGPGSAGQILQSGGASANPAYSTSTYPATNAVNTLLYASSANVMGALATANNGVLITGTAGIPSILADGTTGQVLTATTGSPPSWASPATSGTVTTVSVVSANGFAGTVANATTTPAITLSTTITGVLSGNGTAISGSAVTQYDVLVGGASNAISSVGPGSSGQVLQSGGNSANPAYSTATYPSTATGTGTILRADGTNWVATTSTYPNTNAASTLLYASSANVMGALATANYGILNTSSSGVPSITASPTIGVNSGATTVTIGSNSATSLALDNGVAHGTIPLIDLYHDAATVATDYAYEIDFNAQNSTPAKKTFSSIQSQVSVNTAASEMGTVLINTINAGSSQVNIQVGNNLGQYRGTATNTASPAGFIGEQIESVIAVGSAVTLNNNTNTNLTSINLTAGIWDVSLLMTIGGATTGTISRAGVSTTTANLGTQGDSWVDYPGAPSSVSALTLVVPAYRFLFSTTTTVYGVAYCSYSAGSGNMFGRLKAVRVG